MCKSIVKKVWGVPKDLFALVWLTMRKHGMVVLMSANGSHCIAYKA